MAFYHESHTFVGDPDEVPRCIACDRRPSSRIAHKPCGYRECFAAATGECDAEGTIKHRRERRGGIGIVYSCPTHAAGVA